MAKKTRKVWKQESQQRAIQQALNNVNTAMATAAAKPAVPDAPASVAKVQSDSTDEYKYVKRDLRRIGLLAVSFTAILVVLSFFIK